MDWMTFVLFVCGFVLLVCGADLLVRSASRMAVTMGLTPLVVGLTVVAYGTSAPEAAVCIGAVYADPPQPDISIGNVVGSNISNILLVLGSSAVLAPLLVSRGIVRRGVPLVILVSALFWLMALNGRIGRVEGLLLLAGAAVYTIVAVRGGRRLRTDKRYREDPPRREGVTRQVATQMVVLIVGLAMLILGAKWLVDGAVAVARAYHVSELIVGLTIVAVGTSLPEIATSAMATWRGQRDIAVGNVVGSNLFNVLLVVGLCATVAPDGIPVSGPVLACDMPIMLAASLLCLPVFFTDYRISRSEGWMFLAFFAAYTVFRVLQDTGHPWARLFSSVMLLGAIPLATIVLVVQCIRFSRRSPETLESPS